MTFSGYILVTLMSKWTPKVTKSYIYFGILWHTIKIAESLYFSDFPLILWECA